MSLSALLGGQGDVDGSTGLRLADYVEEITASGFPAIRGLPARVRRAELDAYLDNVVEREFPEQGYPVRRPAVLRAWLAAYAAATSTTATYTKILDAAAAGLANKPAKETTLAYRDALPSLWLLDDLPPWIPGHIHLDRLGQSARHQLADPALAARLLGLDAAALLRAEQGNTDVKHLLWLRDRIGEDLIDAVVVYAGERAYHRRDGVVAVPLALLGP